MDTEYIHNLIHGLYDAKDEVRTKSNKEYIQHAIDNLDELLVAGSIYLDEEE